MSALSSHVENTLVFGSRHPEYYAYLPELEGTYARCTGSLPGNLDDMLQHVTVDCEWCKEEFAHLKKFKDSFSQ